MNKVVTILEQEQVDLIIMGLDNLLNKFADEGQGTACIDIFFLLNNFRKQHSVVGSTEKQNVEVIIKFEEE